MVFALLALSATEATPPMATEASCDVSDFQLDVVVDSLPDPNRGKLLWKQNVCGACHNSNMRDDMTGPALAGVAERWAAFPVEELYEYIRYSQAVTAKGHPQAVKVWQAWRPVLMNNYPELSNEDCADLLAYIKKVSDR